MDRQAWNNRRYWRLLCRRKARESGVCLCCGSVSSPDSRTKESPNYRLAAWSVTLLVRHRTRRQRRFGTCMPSSGPATPLLLVSRLKNFLCRRLVLSLSCEFRMGGHGRTRWHCSLCIPASDLLASHCITLQTPSQSRGAKCKRQNRYAGSLVLPLIITKATLAHNASPTTD